MLHCTACSGHQQSTQHPLSERHQLALSVNKTNCLHCVDDKDELISLRQGVSGCALHTTFYTDFVRFFQMINVWTYS